jgi:hypothetical protein
MKTALAWLGLVGLAAVPALAQGRSVPPSDSPEMAGRPPLPYSDAAPGAMEQLRPLEGRWTCEGQVPRTPYAPAHRTRSAVVISSDLDGFWYSGSVDEQKTPENPRATKARFHWTYDAARRTFRSYQIDNAGGSAVLTSSGWQGDELTWTGDKLMGGSTVPARDVFVKRDAGRIHHRFEARIGDVWTSFVDEDCHRPGAAPKLTR